jgi:4-hydroxy-tetrahydrodipicolinate synthase
MALTVKGIIPAMVTPFDKNEDLDEAGLRSLVDYLVGSGVHGLFCCGSQGEHYALSDDEKKRVAEITIDQTNGRVPVYVGTGAVTTNGAISMTKVAKDVGADAVSIITPYFIKPSASELFAHYKRIAEKVDIPILLYSNPGRTNVTLDPATVARLAETDGIVGMKDSSGDLSLTTEYIRQCPKDFAVLVGRDSLILPALFCGGKGSIAATANVAPKIAVGMYENFMRKNYDAAREAQRKLLPLRLAFELGTFPSVIKEAMTLLGLPGGPTRSPVGPLSVENRNKLRQVLKDIQLM